MRAAFALAMIGCHGMRSPFWPLPSTVPSGPALAAGLASINAIGDFRGDLGSIVAGYPKDAAGGFEAGNYVPAPSSLVSTLTALGRALWMKAPRARVSRLMVG